MKYRVVMFLVLMTAILNAEGYHQLPVVLVPIKLPQDFIIRTEVVLDCPSYSIVSQLSNYYQGLMAYNQFDRLPLEVRLVALNRVCKLTTMDCKNFLKMHYRCGSEKDFGAMMYYAERIRAN